MSAIDFSQLPAPDVIEAVSYEAILAERKADFLSRLPSDLQETVAAALARESEPITKLLEESAYREMVLRQRVNDAARAVMVPLAGENDLVNLGAYVGVQRLTVAEADLSTIPPTPAVLEDVEALRQRIPEAFEGMSVAGPMKAYRFHAESADGRIADTWPYSPAPCEVVVPVLVNGGNGVAPADVLAKVSAALSAEDVRPLGDLVTVKSITPVPYRIVATLYLPTGAEAEPVLAAARARADALAYAAKRCYRSVVRAAINDALFVSGVLDVRIDEPAANIPIARDEAAYCSDIVLITVYTDHV